MKYTIIIPAYCPGWQLIETVDTLTEHLRLITNIEHEIVIVNDGSPKECDSVFLYLEDKATILKHDINRGKGAAIKTGMEYVQSSGQPCTLVFADADGQHLPMDIINCLETAAINRNSLILGKRNFMPGRVPIKSFLGNKLTEGIFWLSVGKHIHDTQTGLRAFDSALIPQMLEAEGDRYEYEMNQLLTSIQDGIPVIEVPIATVYIGNNKGSHFHALRDSYLVYKNLLKFTLSSVSSFLVDYIMFFFFSLFFTGSMGAVISNVLARLISAAFNYEVNRTYVFCNPSNRISSLPRYAALAATVLALNTVILYILNSIVGIPLLLAKIITEACIFIFSWVMQKNFVFQRKEMRSNGEL